MTNPVDEKGLKYHVFFYGTYETAVVPKDGIWIYSQATKEKYGKQKRKGKIDIELLQISQICYLILLFSGGLTACNCAS